MGCAPERPDEYRELRGKPDAAAPPHTRRHTDGQLWGHVHTATGDLRFCDGRRIETIPLRTWLRLIPPDALRAALDSMQEPPQ